MSGNHVCIISTAEFHYHQQEINTWCGAACVQMVLHYLAGGGAPPDQDMLRTEVENRATEPETGIVWFAPPDGIKATLNALAPNPAAGLFKLLVRDTAEDITREIVWNIELHRVPAIALVYGMGHWVVVRGYTADKKPQSAADTSYTILSLDLYDPWPPVPYLQSSALPPVHADLTDGCGSGNERGAKLLNVSYDEWRATGGALHSGYMTGVPAAATDSLWRSRFLAVCDPVDDNQESSQEQPARPDSDTPERDLRAPVKQVINGDNGKIISEEEAARRAAVALRENGLAEREEWRDLLKGTTPDRPQLVGMLERDSVPYYIVPFMAGGVVRAAVRIHAETGKYLQALASGDLRKDAVALLSITEIEIALDGQEFDFDGAKVIFSIENIKDLPTLGWKPCLESFSPFYPFYIIRLQGLDGIHTLYVRAYDGKPYTELTENVAGA